MATKKLCIMTLCVFLLTLAFSGVGNAVPQGTQTVTPLDYGGLRINITAPVQARPGDNITVTVRTSASDVQQVFITYIGIKLYGTINATNRVALAEIDHLHDVALSIHETNYTVTIPDDISPGLTYGEVSCDWKALGVSFEILSSGFVLTYIEDVALEQLQTDYNELNASHQTILQEYNELKSQVTGETSDSTRNLMYVFILTTVVASITVVVLLLRKPKKVWV